MEQTPSNQYVRRLRGSVSVSRADWPQVKEYPNVPLEVTGNLGMLCAELCWTTTASGEARRDRAELARLVQPQSILAC